MTTGPVREWQSTPANEILETLPCGRLQRMASLLGRAPGAGAGLGGTSNAGLYRPENMSHLQARCSLKADSCVTNLVSTPFFQKSGISHMNISARAKGPHPSSSIHRGVPSLIVKCCMLWWWGKFSAPMPLTACQTSSSLHCAQSSNICPFGKPNDVQASRLQQLTQLHAHDLLALAALAGYSVA